MSFWDRYLAPADARSRAVTTSPLIDRQSIDRGTQTTTPLKEVLPPRLDAAARARRQNGLLLGGALFSILSVLISRRAVAKKIGAAPAITATAADGTPIANSTISGGLDAAEALSYATLNVISFGMLGLGAAMKFFDFAEIQDRRDQIRRNTGHDIYGGDAKADKELEEWAAELFMKKDGTGLKEGIVQKLAELDKLAKSKPKE